MDLVIILAYRGKQHRCDLNLSVLREIVQKHWNCALRNGRLVEVEESFECRFGIEEWRQEHSGIGDSCTGMFKQRLAILEAASCDVCNKPAREMPVAELNNGLPLIQCHRRELTSSAVYHQGRSPGPIKEPEVVCKSSEIDVARAIEGGGNCEDRPLDVGCLVLLASQLMTIQQALSFLVL